MQEPVKISISGIKSLLEQGKTRQEIANEYGITLGELKKHFKHPKLKGLRMHKPLTSVLVDDTDEESISDTQIENENEITEELQPEREVVHLSSILQEREEA
jgi:DNA-directed RNA polymerase specialized sigma subunit